MNPIDFYRMKSAEIKEADIRLVAAVMSEHVGEESAVRMEKLVARCGLGGAPGTRHSGSVGQGLQVAYWSSRWQSWSLDHRERTGTLARG